GQKMVVVEDLISTGGSVLEAVAAAQREGIEVLGVIAIFTYQLEKATLKFEQAQVPLHTLTNYSELIQIAQETGYVTEDELEMLKKFKDNQETWNK
ncbi:MAG TPA: orotate phosphoribosyltransferase, partial [Lactococcus sp.]|nr:orotate phosphoribosyltransferase [Lactococcus sp.]